MSARDVIALDRCLERSDSRCAEACDLCLGMADKHISALSAAGLVVVPREPTEAMHNAARDWSAREYGIPIGLDASQGCWTAMIAAAQEGTNG